MRTLLFLCLGLTLTQAFDCGCCVHGEFVEVEGPCENYGFPRVTQNIKHHGQSTIDCYGSHCNRRCRQPQIGDKCQTDAYCPVNIPCINGVCTSPPSMICTSNADCPSNSICINNMCISLSCTSSVDCPFSDVCLSGECQPSMVCTADADCPGGFCDLSSFICLPFSCVSAADCPSGWQCEMTPSGNTCALPNAGNCITSALMSTQACTASQGVNLINCAKTCTTSFCYISTCASPYVSATTSCVNFDAIANQLTLFCGMNPFCSGCVTTRLSPCITQGVTQSVTGCGATCTNCTSCAISVASTVNNCFPSTANACAGQCS